MSQAEIATRAKNARMLLLIEGVLLLVLGAGAIVLPLIASLAVALLLGWLLVIGGVFGLISTFGARHLPGFWWSLLSALLALAAGLVLIVWPVGGLVSVTLVLGIYFLVDGIAAIFYAIEHRREPTARSGWLLLSGVVTLILAAILLAGLPSTAIWAPGLLLGVDLIFAGSALLAVGLALKS